MNLSERLAVAQRERTSAGSGSDGTRDTPGATGSRPARPTDAAAGPAAPASEATIAAARARVLDELGPVLSDPQLDERSLARRVRSVLADTVDAGGQALTAADRSRLVQDVADELLGHGPLESLLRDDEVSEIMVNGPGLVFVERAGRVHATAVRFADDAALRRTIDRMVSRVGRRVDESSPMVDARLPDGSRLNVVLPPLAVDGPVVTIRKFASDPLDIDDLIRVGTLTEDAARLLSAAVRGRANLLVSGSTGAGKTTTLNALSSYIPDDQRIVTIEDAAELRLQQRHVVRLESRPPNLEGAGEVTVRDLLRNALRMRPDRIIIGEVRDSAALDMLQAMSTGHDGSVGTVHASSPREALGRIEAMVLTGGFDLPLRAVREAMVAAIDLIVHQERTRSGARRVTRITEVVGMEGDTITLQDIFAAGPDGDGLVPTGIRARLLDRLTAIGVEA